MDAPKAVEVATAPARSLGFLDLPAETQKDILSHCSQSDLICLCLVSKYFRDLAAAQLYRNFHIVFPDEEDPNFESPIDGLAGGLDTFVSSDYNYAKHLRDLSLDTLSAGDKAEAAYKPYLYSTSCGKFMNTLLLLALRKATSLETFRWNIRVELSRPVYKALHQIQTLNNLHLRLQDGPTLYETPPPLPLHASHPSSVIPSSSAHVTDPYVQSILPPPPPGFQQAPPSVFYLPSNQQPVLQPPKPAPRAKPAKKTAASKEPPTLSGFKHLKSLSVLDIDSLDIITELKACVRNSAGSLTKLKLSFSDSLGLQARKPPPEADPNDSDVDDDFQVVPASGSGGTSSHHDDVSGPAKAFRAQEERKSQELVLGRIFDVEPFVIKKPHRKPRDKEKAAKDERSLNPGNDFINAIKAVSNKLMKDLNGSGDFTPAQLDILDTIHTAAKKYVASEEAKADSGQSEEQKAEGSSDAPSSLEPSEKPADRPESPTSSLFDEPLTKTKDGQKDVKPEDINIEEPEEQLVIDFQEPKETAASSPEASVPEPPSEETAPLPEDPPPSSNIGKAMQNLTAQKENFRTLTEKLDLFEAQAAELNQEIEEVRGKAGPSDLDRIAAAEKRMQICNENIQVIQREMNTIEAEIDDAEKQIPLVSTTDDVEADSRRMHDYLRSTRGLALHSLSIYLIPVKASVLSRAIDFRALRRITLLNVGAQAPIWVHLAKENKESPLPLRKIFTDNVSTAFLAFVSQLEELHELFMLERDAKYKPESFAPKTTTTIDQIRRLVLKKHLPTLKRLVIKNMTDNAWDADDKAIQLICTRGKQLQELACNMSMRAMHSFMQYFPGLVNLRALHVISLRNDDTCVWVMRETKKFLIDNLSHYPELKLEWISIDDDDIVERILRPLEMPTPEEKTKKSKGKQKASILPTGLNNEAFPVLPPVDIWNSDSEDDEDEVPRKKIETMGNIHFYDVWGVRIFKKEVVAGRL